MRALRNLGLSRRAVAMGASSFSSTAALPWRPRVCILGSGWGAFALARELDRSAFDVTMVSPRNHMVFTPLLASTATGTLDFCSVAEPIHDSFRDVRYCHGAATGLDVAHRLVTVETSELTPRGCEPTVRTAPVPYDVLVIAVGARINTFGCPGVLQHAHFLKELADARSIRQHLIRNLEAASFPGVDAGERARLLSSVIVGGGPTGIELAAEMHDFLHEDLARLFPRVAPEVSITLVEASSRVLGGFDSSVRAYAARRFARDGIRVHTGAAVTRLDPTAATLSDGTVLPFGLCVWSTGLAPSPFVTALDPATFAKDWWGRCLTSYTLKALSGAADAAPARHQGAPTAPVFDDAAGARSLPGVFALGDAASVGDRGFAATAQVAEQQGLWLGRTLNAALAQCRGDRDALWSYVPPEPFRYVHRGAMVLLGRFAGASDFTRGAPVAPLYGSTLQGITAWLLWRSAYLTQLGSWRNRVLVPLNWTRTMLFGRDVTQF